jgi:hypothetical protein
MKRQDADSRRMPEVLYVRYSLVAAAILMFIVGSATASSATNWQLFRSPERGFAIQFPGTPDSSSEPHGSGTVYKFELFLSSTTYIADAFEYAPGRDPLGGTSLAEATSRFATAYGQIVSQHPVTIAGHVGIEAVVDDKPDQHVLMDMVAVGRRLYVIWSIGPKGHETSADAKHFRDSFRLLNP